MPFTKPFKNTYEPGDLIYGLHDPMKRLAAQIAGSEHAVRNAAFIQDNLHAEAFFEAIMRHRKYKTASWIETQYEEASGLQIKRISKAGLHWATMLSKKNVHFCLDGINMEAVVKKSHYLDWPQGPSGLHRKPVCRISKEELLWCHGSEWKKRSILGAELRWVYRNRRESNVQRYIQFWKKEQGALVCWKPRFVCCGPPWEDKKYEKLWLVYGSIMRLPSARDSIILHSKGDMDPLLEI